MRSNSLSRQRSKLFRKSSMVGSTLLEPLPALSVNSATAASSEAYLERTRRSVMISEEADAPNDEWEEGVTNLFEDDSNILEIHDEKERVTLRLANNFNNMKNRIYGILEGNPSEKDYVAFGIINVLILLTICASCVIFCLQSLPHYYARDARFFDDPLFIADTVCIIIFSLEALVRLTVVPWSRLFTVFFIVDIVSILGYFVDITIDATINSQSLSGLSLIRALRLIRVFRVFKLSRYSKTLQIVVVVFRNSASGLAVLLVPLIFVVIVFSSILYFVELLSATWNPDRRKWEVSDGSLAPIQSIPDAVWVVMVTITTVGYGDVVPHTWGGKLIAGCVAFIGVLTLSFPNVVLGGNLQFALRAYRKENARRYLAKKFRKVLMVVWLTGILKLVRDKKERARHTEAAARYEIARKHNYFVNKQSCEPMLRKGVDRITPTNVRAWKYQSISAVTVLQRLLEVCSGVGTPREIVDSFPDDADVSINDVTTACYYLYDGGYLHIFVLRRFSPNCVCALTPLAVDELLVHAEDGTPRCIRGADWARIVWKQTTGQSVPFSLHSLYSSYPHWAFSERHVVGQGNPDFKQLRSFRKNSKAGETTGAAKGRMVASMPLAHLHHEKDLPLSERKRQLRTTIALQLSEIKRLDGLLHVNSSGVMKSSSSSLFKDAPMPSESLPQPTVVKRDRVSVFTRSAELPPLGPLSSPNQHDRASSIVVNAQDDILPGLGDVPAFRHTVEEEEEP